MPRLADHLDTEHGPSDDEGGKEAKRQRSEPTTPISSSSRLPHEYDEVMGITQVDPREAERFEEGLDPEYHDATENPQDIVKPDPAHMPCFCPRGFGSSSLRECIELLGQTRSNSLATLHSGVELEKKVNPLQVMSRSVEEDRLLPLRQPLVQYQDNRYSKTSHSLERIVSKMKKQPRNWNQRLRKSWKSKTQTVRMLTPCVRNCRNREVPSPDSEDSLGPEQVVDELRRLTEAHAQMTDSTPVHDSRGGATAPDAGWDTHGPYAPQRARRNRGRALSPDPFMFHSTIWLEHDQEASSRAHEEPIEQLRDRVYTMEQNLETLRTRNSGSGPTRCSRHPRRPSSSSR